MTTISTPTELSYIQAELLGALSSFDKIDYIWNPADIESEDFLIKQEQEFSLDYLSETELLMASKKLENYLEKCWTIDKTIKSDSESITEQLEGILESQFNKVPQWWLNRLAKSVVNTLQNQANQSLSIAQQLVDSVREILSDWSDDDLQVLARPLAYSMRSSSQSLGNNPDQLLASEWDTLSDLEQVRITLAMARLAIDEYYELTK